MKLKLPNLLEKFFSEEEIDCDYKCTNCKKKTSIIKFTEIAVLPSILVLHFKRFDGSHGKHNGSIDFTENINLKNFTVQKKFEDGIKEEYNKNTKYTLFAVAEHIGSSINAGHYIAYCKRNSNWYRFSDSSVSISDEDDSLSKSAYILFYRRKI